MVLPNRHGWMLLLVSSYYFYMQWSAFYLTLIVASTLNDYWLAIAINVAKSHSRRKWLLVASLVTNLGFLFVFKYWNFFNQSAAVLSGYLGLTWTIPDLNVLLPVGPIERATHLLPQLNHPRSIDWPRAQSAILLILLGLFKKVVIADRLSIYVDTVYNNPADHTGTTLLLATYAFVFQIYCDFSAYSDIAIGSARLFNVDLMTNFRSPYLSTNLPRMGLLLGGGSSEFAREFIMRSRRP